MPWAEGMRPVKIEARPGEHIPFVENAFAYRTPPAASLSVCGV